MLTAELWPGWAWVRRWSLLSGVTGVLANVLLVLSYVVYRPWEDTRTWGWMGPANDSLFAVQFAALLPVVQALGGLVPARTGMRTWTRIGVVCAVAVVALQVLLVARVVPFGVQVGPVVLCILVVFGWVGVTSREGARTNTLPPRVARFGRFLSWGLIAGAGVFLAGILIAWLADLHAGAWVVAALPGALVWFAFPGWALLLSRAPEPGRP